MSDLRQIADALAEQVTEATGLRGYAYLPDDVQPPCFLVQPGDIELGAMVRGQMEMTIQIVVLMPRASDRAGQFKVFEYVATTGSQSVWAALDGTDPLGLGDTDAKVIRYRPLGIEEIAAYGYFGGAFEVAVLTSGD